MKSLILKPKIILTFFFYLILFCSAYSQKRLIEIMNNAEMSQTFYLFKFNKKTAFDSVTILPSASTLIKTTAQYPLYSVVVKNANSEFYFFADTNCTVKINFWREDSILVSNSVLDSIWRECYDRQKNEITKIEKTKNYNLQDSLFLLHKDKYEKWGYEKFVSLINIDTFLSLRFLSFHINKLNLLIYPNKTFVDSIIIIVNEMNVEQHPIITKEKLFQKLNNLSYLREGAHVFHFNVRSLSGDSVNTQYLFDGEKTLIDYWASWCKPCREKNIVLKEYYSTLRANGIQIVGISLDRSTENWLNAVNMDELPWLQYIIFNNIEKKMVQEKYNAFTLPFTVLFSAAGKVIKINPSIEDLLSQ